MEHLFGDRLSWDLLIHSQFISSSSPGKEDHYAAVKELERWLARLLHLPIPRVGEELLEVELEVDPAVLLGSPPSCRLPMADLPIHQLFLRLDVGTVIDVYKLLLMEQKVLGGGGEGGDNGEGERGGVGGERRGGGGGRGREGRGGK